MTAQQLEAVGQIVTIAGSLAALLLALVQTIKTLLEVADQLAKRRQARARCQGSRRPHRGRPTGRGSARQGRGPP